jgi:phospholipase C
MSGFAAYEANKLNSAANEYCNVMSGFTKESLPVMNTLAQEFAVFDRLFASVPGPTWPNRLYALTATSMGNTDVDIWFQGEPGQFYTQKTIFEQLDESGYTWRNYYNDTPWELMLNYVAHNLDNLEPMDSFFYACETGTLPTFSWINPRTGINVTTGIGSNDFHPTHDVSAAESYYKDIYEAIRSSPKWNSSLFIITFDEHGGFYDHVPTPKDGVPSPGDNTPSNPDLFEFDRLGVRLPTLAISPWIEKGTVISEAPAKYRVCLLFICL